MLNAEICCDIDFKKNNLGIEANITVVEGLPFLYRPNRQ